MSGIAGVYHLDGRPVSEELDRMTDALKHRGPDGANTWREGSVGLAHLMLETTPEDQYEALPLVDRSGNFAITADARIDNRDELIKTLDVRKPDDRPITDTELILAAYKRWGRDCPKHLLGAFAFAVWDGRSRKLVCGRDHIGFNPLYYAHFPERFFAFATEMKALLKLSLVRDTFNVRTLGRRLALVGAKKGETIYRDIQILPSATTLTASREGVKDLKYWALKRPSSTKTTEMEDEAAVFKEHFFDAVACRMRSSTPIAAELSGGLDSSSVAGSASAISNSAIHTISLQFESFPKCDESEYIDDVVRQIKSIPHFESGEKYSRLSNINEILDFIDDGTTPVGSHHTVWQRAEIAGEIGTKVLLTGFDGDSTVYHGFEYLSELSRKGDWENFEKEVKKYFQNMKKEGPPQNDQLSITRESAVRSYGYKGLQKHVNQKNYSYFFKGVFTLSDISNISQYQMYRRFGRRIINSIPVLEGFFEKGYREKDKKEKVPSIIDKDFALNVNLPEVIQAENARRNFPSVREAQWALLTSGHMERTLESLNHYAAANGIELRHPFMDKRLIEYCLSLPSEMSFNNGWSRLILRKAMDGVIPETIRWRFGKTGLYLATSKAFFQRDGALLREIVENLGDLGDFVNYSAAKSIVEKGTTEGPDTLSPAEVGQLNVLAGLVLQRQ